MKAIVYVKGVPVEVKVEKHISVIDHGLREVGWGPRVERRVCCLVK